MKWRIDFNAGKTQFILFDQFDNSCAVDVKMGCSFLNESYVLRCWDYISLLNRIGLSRFLKLLPRKLDP